MKKGYCRLCKRTDQPLVALDLCASDYALVRRFNGNEKAAAKYRESHPVGYRRGSSKRSSGAQPGQRVKPVVDIPRPSFEPKSKTWLDVQIDDAIARVINLVKQNGGKNATVEVDVAFVIKDVRIKQVL